MTPHPRNPLALALVFALGACASESPFPTDDGADPYDGSGSLEEGLSFDCGASTICSGGGTTYSAVYRLGATATSRGELLQLFELAADGHPASVTLDLRNLRAFTSTGPALLHAEVYAVSSASAPDVDVSEVLAPVAEGTHDLASPNAFGHVTIAIAGDQLQTGQTYALRLYTDALPEGSIGSLLVGVAALATSSEPFDGASFGTFRRGLRRASALENFDVPTRFRAAGAWDVAVALELTPAECSVPEDCPGEDTACATRTCTGGLCGTSYEAEGTAVPSQVAGDCHEDRCDGAGNVTSVVVDTDVPDDENACTADVCSAGSPSNDALALGSPCAEGGGDVCDGAGSCVPLPSVESSLVPILSSNVSAAPLTVSSSTFHGNGTLQPWKAFNQDASAWNTGFCLDAQIGWLEVDLVGARTVTSYTVRARDDAPQGTPTAWTVEGSNDHVSWTLLDTRSAEVGWSSPEVRSYVTASPAAVRYVRFNFSANGGYAITCTQELTLRGFPANFPGESLVPVLSSNTSASPIVVSASSAHGNNDLQPWKAFNRDASSWPTGFCLDAITGWLQVDLGTARTVGSYTIRSRDDAPQATPTTWTLQGSDDLVGWTTLDSPPVQSGWVSGQIRTFPIAAPQARRYYRFNLAANGGYAITCTQEVELLSE